MPEETSTTLALPTDPKIVQELRIVLPAILVSLGAQELTVDFKQRKEDLTAAVLEFTQPPTNLDEQNEILAAQRGVSKLRTELEKNAEAMKAPLNNARTKIIELVKNAVEDLKKVEGHAQGLVNNYQQKLTDELNRQAAEAQRQRDAIARKEQEAQRQREQADRDREAARLAQERADQAKSAAARNKLEEEAEALRQKANASDTSALNLELAVESAPEIAAPTATPAAKEIKGFTLNGRNDHEKGENLKKLFAKHPEFFACHIKEDGAREFSIKLKIKDLTDALEGTPPFQKLESAPGITITTKLSTLR